MTTTSTYTAHYISGTHWDREWYRPVQEFRLLLVEVMDELLDLMESSADFRYFHLDGQTCVLQDYLEVRPERRDRLAALMREGRILIGPWFTMPDLWCPGDEALVRNLLMGRRIAREWGVEPMPVAYTCDMFGHPSQMPQIYQGFGLRHCVLGRGTNEHTTPAFFTWKAPDGSRVFTFKLQDAWGYGAFIGSRNALERAGADGDLEAEWQARASLQSYVRHEITRTNGSVLCLIDALDHTPPATDAPRYLRVLHEACPEVTARHSTLPAFFADAEASATDMPVIRGELRESARDRCEYLWLIPNCVSSRVRQKQANDACQTLLERWVEPWMALANLHGAAMPDRYLRLAWEWLLLNHAHDSICGCSIDQVHRDMHYRFEQVLVLGQQLKHKALGALTRGYRELATAEHEFTVTLANPLPVRRHEAVVFDIDLPKDYPISFTEGFRSQTVKAFTLHDADGQEIPYQRLTIDLHAGERTRYARPGLCSDGPDNFLRYTVAADVELPALGFTSLLVRPSTHPVRYFGSLRTGPTSAENAHLAISIAPNGTLTLVDKRTGEVYTDLLMMEDSCETGDGWFHGGTVADEVLLSAASPAQVAIIHDGPEMVTFEVAVTLHVPVRYLWHEERRSADRVVLPVTHRITLRRGAITVDVETVVGNTAEDHRLRLLLPTDARDARTYLAHHPYDLVERSIALDAETATWKEPEIAEKPFLGLQAVGAGQRGLAFLSGGGLHEGGVVDDRRRTMQVTLLRSYRRTVGTQGEQDGLERGTLTYRYALLPFAGTLPRVEALYVMGGLQGGITTRQTGTLCSGFPPLAGEALPVQSYLELRAGTLVISALKAAESGEELIVRLWNPTETMQQETLACWRPLASAQYVSLAEESMISGETPVIDGNSVTVTAGPKQVVTVALRFTE
jgi:alpha-mannosidase/mannosylglycerate hydrolase